MMVAVVDLAALATLVVPARIVFCKRESCDSNQITTAHSGCVTVIEACGPNVLIYGDSESNVTKWDIRGSRCRIPLRFLDPANSNAIESLRSISDTNVLIGVGPLVLEYDMRYMGSGVEAAVQITANAYPNCDVVNGASLDSKGDLVAVVYESGAVRCYQRHGTISDLEVPYRVINEEAIPCTQLVQHEVFGTSVQFLDHQPRVFLSGGMDCCLKQSEVTNGQVRVVDQLQFQSSDGGHGFLINPPFVNTITPLRGLGRGVICGLGDGSVSVLTQRPRKSKLREWDQSRHMIHSTPVIYGSQLSDETSRLLSADVSGRIHISDIGHGFEVLKVFQRPDKINAVALLENKLAVADTDSVDIVLLDIPT
jgi:WD40 repeat protein